MPLNKEKSLFKITRNTYQLQRRPSHTHMITNHEYMGINIIELERGTILDTISYPPQFLSAGGIATAWCLSSHGREMVVFDGEHRVACWLALDGSGESLDISNYPDWKITFDLRYFWDTKLWVVASKNHALYRLDATGNTLAFVPQRHSRARQANPRWAEVKGELFPIFCTILQVDSDLERFLFHIKGEYKIGVASWNNGEFHTCFYPDTVSRLAASQKHLFVMEEYQVNMIDIYSQKVVEKLSPPSGLRYVGLDVIYDQNHSAQSLVLGCQEEHLLGENYLLVYQLNE